MLTLNRDRESRALWHLPDAEVGHATGIFGVAAKAIPEIQTFKQ